MRLLQSLYIVAAAVVVVAVWQFTVHVGGGREPGAGWAGLDPLFGRDGATSADPSEAVPSPSEAVTTPATSAATSGGERLVDRQGGGGGGVGGDAGDGVAGGSSSGASPSSSPSAEPPVEESHATPGPPAGCTARLRLDGSWQGAFQATVEVVNDLDERIEGWEIVLDLEGAQVTGAWGLRHVDGHRWGNVFWNGGLHAGQSTTATFHAAADDAPSLPAAVPCSVA